MLEFKMELPKSAFYPTARRQPRKALPTFREEGETLIRG
jgi:hypothetical protein